ncbi:MAG: hypothetical protein AAFY26_07030 [Cyanobacteria bacterium J06638_22]
MDKTKIKPLLNPLILDNASSARVIQNQEGSGFVISSGRGEKSKDVSFQQKEHQGFGD